jgi:hypothetical protein
MKTRSLARRGLCLSGCLWLICTLTSAQQSTGSLRGHVTDQLGGLIVGAVVTITAADGTERSTTSNAAGAFVIANLPPGSYSLLASAKGFSGYRSEVLGIRANEVTSLEIVLQVIMEEQRVTVKPEDQLSLDPANNADQIVLRSSELEALPDDPQELAAALRALAGDSGGPEGGEIMVDGFTATRLPPKNTIREVRINQNPFSAENDRLGSRSVEVFTKPGTEHITGEAFLSFNDRLLNSRNPFATNRAPFRSSLIGGVVGGPLVKNKASYFIDFERRTVDDNAVINATVLDRALNATPLALAVLAPSRTTSFDVRTDFQMNKRNTLIARYSLARSSVKNNGVGGFVLQTGAYDTSVNENKLQISETAVLSKTAVNETRFQLARLTQKNEGDNSVPIIHVLDAFVGGGAQIGLAANTEDRWVVQNDTTWLIGKHSLKAGLRLRHVEISDHSSKNFGGTFIFSGGLAPRLDDSNHVVTDAEGNPIIIPITSLERYRRTLLFQQAGLAPAAIAGLGGGATQFSIAAGDDEARIGQTDGGAYIQDDWAMRKNFTLSLGLRYELQNNIIDKFNFAPRLRFAWTPLGVRRDAATLVVRGGIGIFYDRFNEKLGLQAERFNGLNQQQYIVNDPAVLGSFPQVPSRSDLIGAEAPQTFVKVAGNLRSPYSIQSALGIDQQLPFHTTLSVTYLGLRTLHALRSRNINAPLPEEFLDLAGTRPFGQVGNIYQYESSGIVNQQMLMVLLNSRFNKKITFFTRYILAKVKSDTDGASVFPMDQYDLTTEYGRSSLDIRHRFFLAGTFSPFWRVRFSPFLLAVSGRPFNIITGQDLNNDTRFTERPAFATDLSRPSVRITRFGAFDTDPLSSQQIIPRNYGTGPAFFSFNLRMSRTFGFGNVSRKSDAEAQQGGGRYNLTVAVQAQNLFNHTNGSNFQGNLSSPQFGRATASASGFSFSEAISSAAGNRRIEFVVNLSF